MDYVYGIGNPLIDYLCTVTDEDLSYLGLSKGTMLLIDEFKQQQIVNYTKNKNVKFAPGGSCPNTMVTLSALGYPTVLAGGVGNDELGNKYRERLVECGVKDECISKDAVTGTSIILLSEDRERTMNTYLGANRLFGPEDINEESAKNAKLFYFTGYMYDTESQKASINKVLRICKDNSITVAFDLADPFAVARYRSEFFSLIKEYCDIVFANSEEARFLFDNYDAYECAKSMRKLCSVAIVKNGKKGSYIAANESVFEIPLSGTDKPVDTTGAGDTYAAGFLFGYLNGLDIEKCGNIASYLAGEIIGHIGAQFSESEIKKARKHIKEKIIG